MTNECHQMSTEERATVGKSAMRAAYEELKKLIDHEKLDEEAGVKICLRAFQAAQAAASHAESTIKNQYLGCYPADISIPGVVFSALFCIVVDGDIEDQAFHSVAGWQIECMSRAVVVLDAFDRINRMTNSALDLADDPTFQPLV